MAATPTKTVTLKDGTEAVINAADFDPSVHTETGAEAPKPRRGRPKKTEA
jgi:hypothetical protein